LIELVGRANRFIFALSLAAIYPAINESYIFPTEGQTNQVHSPAQNYKLKIPPRDFPLLVNATSASSFSSSNEISWPQNCSFLTLCCKRAAPAFFLAKLWPRWTIKRARRVRYAFDQPAAVMPKSFLPQKQKPFP